MNSTSTSSNNPPETQPDQEERSLFANFRLVSLMTFLSRVLGLVRDMGMAMLFGNGPIMDAFSIAFRIPNLARRLFGEGALSTAFLPAFVREREQHGLDSAWRLVTATLLWLTRFLSAVTVGGLLLLLTLYLAGLDSPEYQLLLGLTAIMLPYLLLICLVAQISAVMHAQNRFGWPAFSPLILNGLWIFTIWMVAPVWSSPRTQVVVIAVSVLLAGAVQLVGLLLPLFRMGYRYTTDWREAKSDVREVLRSMIPVLIGLSIAQINAVSDSLIAWVFSAPEEISQPAERIMWVIWGIEYPLKAGTASALYFGQRLFQFPLGLFGLALGTVLFPFMTRHAETGQQDRLQQTLLLGLKQVIGIALPASVGMILLSKPITRLLFEYGQFTSEDAGQTAKMIAAYGAAVWSSCALLILHRGFYALGDRMTPLYVGLQMVALNLVLNMTLIWIWQGVGLAISTAICAAIQVVIVIKKFEKQVGRLDRNELGKTIFKTTIAVLVMGIACGGLQLVLPDSVTFIQRLWNVVIPLLGAVLVYFGAAWLLKMDFLWSLFRRDAASNFEP
ncbi:MAG: murein biosynthesis integral membrane protein MurJ [Planctomycetaceae bacterium]|nr:murein biosynthesis integral membrane protein MurJ [Planctomycetaceae bacterium]